ncbi:hypothetical protein [Streptomyces sp. NPDC059278]|uniref:hypothetical protein n=1 Tax=Streptomyces sp. NPDC059278 TaxID=3346801 RepID=UPI0036AC9B5C
MTKAWTPNKIVRVDREGDRERASDGHSRYGAYVGDRELKFRAPDSEPPTPLEPIEFAMEAWRVACSPVMSPGLVQWRPDLHRVALELTGEGRLAVVVTLPLTHRSVMPGVPWNWDDWQRYGLYTEDGYAELGLPDLKGKDPLLTVSAQIRYAPEWTLLQANATTGIELVEECIASVEHTAATINQEVGPLVSRLLGGGEK